MFVLTNKDKKTCFSANYIELVYIIIDFWQFFKEIKGQFPKKRAIILLLRTMAS